MAEELLTKDEVSAIVKLSVVTIYDRMKKGTFPRPKRLGKQARRWRRADIDEWIASLSEADTEEWHCPQKKKRAGTVAA